MATQEQLLADLTSGNDARAAAAVPALTVHGESALKGLRKLLAAPLADHRWWAVRALSAFPSQAARSALTAALEDPDVGVRQCAALALRSHPGTEAIPRLIDCMDDDDRLLARLAGDALAAIGEAAIPALSAATQKAPPRVRIEAARALATMGQPDAIAPLFKLIDDPSTMVRHWAEEGLERLSVGMAFFQP